MIKVTENKFRSVRRNRIKPMCDVSDQLTGERERERERERIHGGIVASKFCLWLLDWDLNTAKT
jgi:hypothetical protein